MTIKSGALNPELEIEKAEISFTFHYYISGVLRLAPLGDKQNTKNDERKKLNPLEDFNRLNKIGKTLKKFIDVRKDWKTSAISHYISDNFLDELMITHFHLNLDEIVKEIHEEIKQNCDLINLSEAQSKGYFEIPKDFPYDRNNGVKCQSSIGSLEVFIWKHGSASVIFRLGTTEDIKASELLNYIKHPEFAINNSGASTGLEAGKLICQVNDLMDAFEPYIEHALNCLKLEKRVLKTGDWAPLDEFKALQTEKINRLNNGKNRSRAYVGTMVGFDKDALNSFNKTPEIDSMVKRFVVAAGRTTPSFFEKFERIDEYLDSGRNIYGRGGSIIFLGRRGWCVLNGGEHEPITFRLGVVETTHFAICVIETAMRARRKYCRDIHEAGTTIFKDLNASVDKMVTTLGQNKSDDIENWENYKNNVANSTSFLARARAISPCEDMSGLLLSHLTSHTCRAAVKRFSELTKLNLLNSVSRELMSNYTAFLKTSSDYLNTVSVQDTEKLLQSANETQIDATETLKFTKNMFYLVLITLVITVIFNCFFIFKDNKSKVIIYKDNKSSAKKVNHPGPLKKITDKKNIIKNEKAKKHNQSTEALED